ncbi:hypothetical protein THAR02_10734 [Trichoderma harzianum]|uniref:Uncharacterized protein n=1 Tax=Trichoderma harzianum TaxID=5544 RepID=A0A0F9WXJ3_TRIHA|nr:hypothetical protein THAR02_10734 [Trichoderma harzianum]
MLSLKSTLFFVLGCASAVPTTESDRGYQLAVPVPCSEDSLTIALASQANNSTAGAGNASLEKRDCSWGGTFFEQGGCSSAGSQFSKCVSGGTGCVLTNSVLAFGYNSILATETSCDLRIWLGGCNDGFSFGIPAGSPTGLCWGGFGTAHGYSVQC